MRAMEAAGIDWTRRAQGDGIAPFGDAVLGEAYNRGLFRAKARALASALRSEPIPPPSRRRCLDAGVGHGWLLETWRRQRVGTIAGVELVEAVAERARRAVPDARIAVTGLQDWSPGPDERYDLVTALDVLFYLDDRGFERAVRALAEAVAPGGLLVVADSFAERTIQRPGCRHRPWKHYADLLVPAGLAPCRRRGFFVLANAPYPTDAGGTRWQNLLHPLVYEGIWNLSRARSPLARPLEKLAIFGIFGLDALILSQGGRWGSQEIAVWRKEG